MSLIGRKIGSIRIESLLGRGGMGKVYRGFDERLERAVAIKTLRGRSALRDEARARFLREARVLSRLNHPNICQIYDLIEGRQADYLVLELVEGRTLKAIDPHSLSMEEKLRIAEAVVEAMAAAHREQIIHRDLKPDNIMLTPEGKVKVLDFGIARPLQAAAQAVAERPDTAAGSGEPAVDGQEPPPGDGATAAATAMPGKAPPALGVDEPEAPPDPDRTLPMVHRRSPVSPNGSPATGSSPVTSASTAVGTLSYMSPEQARREPLDVASDLYSLGMVLQELFTGRRALPKLPADELAARVRRGESEPPVGLAPELTALINRLKSLHPEDRPTTAATLAHLRAIREQPERRRRRRLAWAAVVVLLVLLAASSAALWHSRQQARQVAELAQSFTQEAYTMESALRLEHLAPAHDIRPTVEAVRQRMGALTERMEAVPSLGRGPGEYALGRVALALEDFAEARHHFEAAWQADYRPPQVAAGLGLATFELYRDALSQARRLGDGEERRRELERLDRELRRPSLAYLARARQLLDDGRTTQLGDPAPERYRGPADAPAYIEALIAFYEGRYEQALAEAESTVQRAPLFFEGYLLEGKIHRARCEQLDVEGRYEESAAAYRRARQALAQAAEVGRSHPGVQMEICELNRSRVVIELYAAGDPSLTPYLDDGRAACDTVLTIDPDDAGARRVLAQLLLREAEFNGDSELSRAGLERAAELMEEALARDGENPTAWRTLGHISTLQSDWQMVAGWPDPQHGRELLGRAAEAYRRALALAPREPRLVNALGNTFSLRASLELAVGDDPRPAVAEALAHYRQAAELEPRDSTYHGNILVALGVEARYEVRQGIDPAATVSAAEESFARTRQLNTGYHGGYEGLAAVLLSAAAHQRRQGGDPTPELQRAARLCRQALELSPERYYERRTLAGALLGLAEIARQRGEEPGPPLAEAQHLVSALLAEGDGDPVLGQLAARAEALAAPARAVASGGS